MADRQPVRLICVTDINNNKFYNMTPQGDSFLAEWGRVGGNKSSKAYPMYKWDSIYRDKTGKGYKDVTHLAKVVEKNSEFKQIADPKVDGLITMLLGFSRTSVKQNYTISSEAVTQAQVTEAQGIVDRVVADLSGKTPDWATLNKLLLELYAVIPRRMTKVQDHLIRGPIASDADLQAARSIIDHEQATLDVMGGQVKMNVIQPDDNAPEKTLLEVLGIEVVPGDPNDVAAAMRLMGTDCREFKAVYRVNHPASRSRFTDYVEKAGNKKLEMFWHGSRNENWISILQTGLKIRPSNAILTGAMFGHGIYFADKYRKSAGYTSLNGSYWARGGSNTAFLAIMDVHVGKQLVLQRFNYDCYSLNKQVLQAKGGYDSLFAMGGADLRNNEYIIYDDAQSTIKYLVQVGN